MAKFFTSDPHWFHTNILTFESEHRPFSTVEEMNEVLVENINSRVKKNDMLYFLGDIVFGNKQENLKIINRINGRKVLIPGNHDYFHPLFGEKKAAKYRPMYQEVFDALSRPEEHTYIGGHLVRLCHFPYEGDHQEQDRHTEYRPVDDGTPLVHGHVHSLWKIRGHQFNVGVEVSDLFPVHEDDICEWLETL